MPQRVFDPAVIAAAPGIGVELARLCSVTTGSC
jgi:hypothetical protein